MSVLDRLKRWRLSHQLNEGDAPADTDVAMTRETGGNPDGGTQSTTGVRPASPSYRGRLLSTSVNCFSVSLPTFSKTTLASGFATLATPWKSMVLV